MAKKRVIGITGGIGSGKSSVSTYLKNHYDSTFISADRIGRILMGKGRSIYKALVKEYGTQILKKDQTIDTVSLSQIAFHNRKSQEKINRIEHPLIREEIMKRIDRTEKPVIFLEAALLREGDLVSLCDYVLYVYADSAVRKERLKSSRGYSDKKIETFFALQKKDSEYQMIADAIIDNSGTFLQTKKAAECLMKQWKIPKKNRKRKTDGISNSSKRK